MRDCSFCRVSCPTRAYFKEPDSGLPLTCDRCESDPPLEESMCVHVCRVVTLSEEEREEEAPEEEMQDEMKIGLEAVANQFGLDKIIDTVVRMAKTNHKKNGENHGSFAGKCG